MVIFPNYGMILLFLSWTIPFVNIGTFIVLGITTGGNIIENDWRYLPEESTRFNWLKKLLFGRNISTKL